MAFFLTKRDLKMMLWINGYFAIQAPHVATYLRISHVTTYARLLKLVQAGYLSHEKLFYNEAGTYRLTHEGVLACGDDLPALRKVNLQTYRHDVAVASLSLALLQQHPAAQFIPERRLRRQQGVANFSTTTHVADGVLMLEGKTIAIEVELTTKSEKRLHNILHHYLKHPEYKEVWYFCGCNEVKNRIERMSQNFPFVKIFDLQIFDLQNFDLKSGGTSHDT